MSGDARTPGVYARYVASSNGLLNESWDTWLAVNALTMINAAAALLHYFRARTITRRLSSACGDIEDAQGCRCKPHVL